MRTGANLMNWFNTRATKRTLSRLAARLGAPGRPDPTTDAWYSVEAWDGITDDLPEWVADYRDFEHQVATMPVETAVRLFAEYQEHLAHRVSCEGFWRDCPDCQWADLRCNQELSAAEAVLDKRHPDLVRRTREVFEAAMAQKAHLPTTATSVQHHQDKQ
jgi:hypothetical protein